MRHPKEKLGDAYPGTADLPFPSEDEAAQRNARVIEEQRRRGGQPLQPADAPVQNDTPYRNLS